MLGCMERMLDRDTGEVMAILRGAVASSGLSQAGFARAMGTSAARLSTYLNGETRPSAYFLVRGVRLGRGLGSAAARGLMSAPTTAAAMREHYLSDDVAWTWRMLLQGRDHLVLILAGDDGDRAELLAGWEAAPGSVGDPGWDTFLAAVVMHEFEQAGLTPPSWATDRAPLSGPWMPEHPFLSRKRVEAQTPAWLRRRNIFVPQRDLVTA
jgi:transcriptional regulator with XRE-family HTH domain